MKKLKNFIILNRILLVVLLSICSIYAHAFVVKKIDVQGLYKVHKSTVLEALSVKVEDKFSEHDTKNVIHKLYTTEFFEDVKLSKGPNQSLIIKVKERPTIASVTTEGHKDFSKDQMNKVLKAEDLIKGRMLDRVALERLKKNMKYQYKSKGKQDVSIETILTPKPKNRVDIKIVVNEGKPTLIKKISFVGNKKYSKYALFKKLDISPPRLLGLLTYFTETDKYSKAKLDSSIDALNEFYQNRGHVEFKVLSSKVDKVPNTNEVHITFELYEGPVFSVKKVNFVGNTILSDKELMAKVTFDKGDVFSRKETLKTKKNINDLLADEGYTFSVIDVQPEAVKGTHDVIVNYVVNPGRPIYVRKIMFTGNHKTGDYVLRQVFKQEEGALLSSSRVEESLRQVRLLEYIDTVNVAHKPVEGTNNLVDLDVKVEEGQIMQMQASAGLGSSGAEVDLGVNNNNILGTGKSGDVHFKWDSWGQIYSASAYDPYFTKSGIGSGLSIYFQKHDPDNKWGKATRKFFGSDETSILSYAATDKYGMNWNFNVPISDHNSINAGVGLEYLNIVEIITKDSDERVTGTPEYSAPLKNFIDTYGTFYRQVKLSFGWTRMGYDQLPFPTKGIKNSIYASLHLPYWKRGLSYYKLGTTNKAYLPLFKGFILTGSANVHFANGFDNVSVLPFYENYHAGGQSEGMVRGYETASLGPQDNLKHALGGNLLISGGLGLILPEPISGENMRVSLFLDAGNVYQTSKDNRFTGIIGSGHIRLSAGAALEWRTPFGILNLGVGFALNPREVKLAGLDKPIVKDKTELIFFNVGHSF